MFVALTGVLALASCTSSDDYEMVEKLSGAQVYFPNTLSATVNLPATATTYEIPVNRVNTSGALEVPLQVTYDGEAITFPNSVTFADGANEAKIVVTYDANTLGFDNFESAKITIGNDEYTTIYGASAYEVNLGIPAPWTSLGKATVHEDFWTGLTYGVEIQQNDIDKQTFRLIKPFPGADFEQASEMLEFRIYHAGETLMGETLTQDIVYWDYNCAAMTYYANYDDVITLVWPGSFTKYPTQDSWTHNTVLSYQENGLPATVQFAPFYYMFSVGGWDYTQNDGMFTITFPGVEIKDYSVEVSYAGKFESADGEISAVANVTLGEDVASAKAAVIAGRENTDVVNGIVAGSLENIVDAKSGEVKIPMPTEAESGTYTIGIVTYDATGEAQEYALATFNYSASGEVKETWTPVFLGDYTYKYVFCNSDGSPYVDENLVLYESDVNENRYKIENVFYGVDFVFEMDDDGYVTFEDQYTGYTDSSAGDLMFCDMNALYPDNFPKKSYYSNGQFFFNIGFYANDGWWGYDQSDNNDDLETFTLTANAAKGMKKAPKKGNRKANVKHPEHVKKHVAGGRPVKAALVK